MLALVSRPKNLSAGDWAPVLQGVIRPGQQAETDLWGCQAGLQDGWRRAAQHRDRKRAAADREVHRTAAGWGRWLLDWAPSQPALPGRDHKPGLSLTVLLVGWKQGQVQVFFSCVFFSFHSLCMNMFEWISGKGMRNHKGEGSLKTKAEKGCSQRWLD